MKFGIFYEHQLPRPWHERSEYELIQQAGKNTHEDICESLELFGREVMPEFQDRESLHQEWKQGVLSGDIKLAEIDTEAHTFSRPNLGTASSGAAGQ